MKRIINQPVDFLLALLSLCLIPIIVVLAILYVILIIIERSLQISIDKDQTLFAAVAILTFVVLLAWGAIFDNDDTPDTNIEYEG